MSIIKWEDGKIHEFEDQVLEQDILIAILKMTPEEINNPWHGDIVIKPRLKRIVIELTKDVRGGTLYGKIGQESHYDRKYYPGGMKLSMGNTVSLQEHDLQTLWLVSRIGHQVLINTKQEYGFK